MGQNDSKPILDCKHQQSLLKGYRPLSNFNLHHLSNDLQVFIDMHSNHLCINKFELDWRSPQILYDTNTYYRQRMRLNTHHLITIYHTDIFAMGRNESIRQHLQQFGTLPQQNKVNVNTSCSLNIFQQNCQKNIITPKISPQQLQLHLYHQYINTTLENEAQSRKKTNHKYSEKQLWTILSNAVSAGYELVSKGFKEPLLSPVAVKLDNNGNMFFGQWQFSHFFQDQNEVDEDTHFFEEGQAYLKDTSRLSDKVGKTHRQNYNILTSYYWAPEGTAAMQNAVTLGKLKKPSFHSITTSRLHSLANSQIFSLGMTLLHLILLKPLYQSETYSEKKINNYLQEAIKLRIQQNSPLTKEFITVISKMLKWSPQDRISYADLQDEIHSNSRSRSRTVFSIFTSEIREDNSKIPIAKDAQGSGSVNQGSGDIDHPQQQQIIPKPGPLTIRKADCNMDYGKVDFTIKRERKEWQKFENRLMQSEYKIIAHQDYNTKMICSAICSYTNNSSKQNSALSFPAEILMNDEEDTPNEENLCKVVPKQDSVQNMDHNTEGGDGGQVGFSRISDSIKILDISNIKAGMDDSINRHNQSKQSVLNFNAALEESEESFTKMIRDKKSQNINTSDSDSLLLKSSIVPQFQYPTIAPSKEDNLFTPPQFLDFIRTQCMRQSKYSQAKAEQQNELQTSIEAQLTNSTFVKQSFAKGCYEGGKVDGLRNGYGTFYYNEGGKYCGDWQNNQMHGKGTLYYADGRIAYQGEWRFDSLNGKGILYNQNPVQLDEPYDYRSFNESQEYWAYYEGSFHQDDKWGNGILFLSNGEKFEGSFKNDLIDGKGVFWTIEGMKILGEWSNNKLVRVISQSPYQGSQV